MEDLSEDGGEDKANDSGKLVVFVKIESNFRVSCSNNTAFLMTDLMS